MTITFKRLDPSAAIQLARGQECQWLCVGECQLRIQDLAKAGGGGGGGGAVYGRGGTLTMNACEARGGYEKQGVRGGRGGGGGFCPF